MGSTRTSIEIRFRVFAPGSPPPPPTGPTAPGPLEDGAGGTGAITQVCGGGGFFPGGGPPTFREKKFFPVDDTGGERGFSNNLLGVRDFQTNLLAVSVLGPLSGSTSGPSKRKSTPSLPGIISK